MTKNLLEKLTMFWVLYLQWLKKEHICTLYCNFFVSDKVIPKSAEIDKSKNVQTTKLKNRRRRKLKEDGMMGHPTIYNKRFKIKDKDTLMFTS